MIITTAKERDNILSVLEGHASVFIIGCGSCAAACQTGGEKEVEDMKRFLVDQGKTVTGSAVPDETCHQLVTRKELIRCKEQVDGADCMLVLACGAGVQSVGALREDKPVYSALDSLFLGNVHRLGKYSETCSMCGQCVLNETGGICPITRCAKGLLNGPCGGTQDGKCEVYPDRDCAWVLIFNRLKAMNKLDTLTKVRPPKDYSVREKPFYFEIAKKKQ